MYNHSKNQDIQNHFHLSQNINEVYNLCFDKIYLFLVGKVKDVFVCRKCYHITFLKNS